MVIKNVVVQANVLTIEQMPSAMYWVYGLDKQGRKVKQIYNDFHISFEAEYDKSQMLYTW